MRLAVEVAVKVVALVRDAKRMPLAHGRINVDRGEFRAVASLDLVDASGDSDWKRRPQLWSGNSLLAALPKSLIVKSNSSVSAIFPSRSISTFILLVTTPNGALSCRRV